MLDLASVEAVEGAEVVLVHGKLGEEDVGVRIKFMGLAWIGTSWQVQTAFQPISARAMLITRVRTYPAMPCDVSPDALWVPSG